MCYIYDRNIPGLIYFYFFYFWNWNKERNEKRKGKHESRVYHPLWNVFQRRRELLSVTLVRQWNKAVRHLWLHLFRLYKITCSHLFSDLHSRSYPALDRRIMFFSASILFRIEKMFLNEVFRGLLQLTEHSTRLYLHTAPALRLRNLWMAFHDSNLRLLDRRL